jgi:Holliday junction resolvase-like predicted endonuclease
MGLGLRIKRVGSEEASRVSAAPYPRRQQAYRLKRAAGAGAGAVAITAAGLTAALDGLTAIAVVLLLTAGAVGLYARHWARLARRSRVGARSEDLVRQVLATLEREGWRLRHSIAWHRGGDIDHVAIAPTGVAFAIETKTRAYNPLHLAKVNEQAAWLARHRRRWCPQGCMPVLCVTRGRVEQVQHDVLVVSVNRLVGALRAAAGTSARPKFLIGDRSLQGRQRHGQVRRRGPSSTGSGVARDARYLIQSPPGTCGASPISRL